MAVDIFPKVQISLKEFKRLIERADERWVDDVITYQELQEKRIKVLKRLSRVIPIIDQYTKGE